MYMAGYEAAARSLIAAGLVEGDKVALMGFSRTGWHVDDHDAPGIRLVGRAVDDDVRASHRTGLAPNFDSNTRALREYSRSAYDTQKDQN